MELESPGALSSSGEWDSQRHKYRIQQWGVEQPQVQAVESFGLWNTEGLFSVWVVGEVEHQWSQLRPKLEQ